MLLPTDDSVCQNKKQKDGSDRMRLGCFYQLKNENFIVRKHQFKQQYCYIYRKRLAQLRGTVEQEAARIWKNHRTFLCSRLGELLETDDDMLNICSGTVFKRMQLRPSVLEEYREERGITENIGVPIGNFFSSDDCAVLEDETGQITLVPDEESSKQVLNHSIPTGVVISVLGKPLRNGQLLVKDWCVPGLPPQPDPPQSSYPSEDTDMFVLVVSGLHVGDNLDPFPTRLLLDHITGYIGIVEETEKASMIVRVILCGNSSTIGVHGDLDLDAKNSKMKESKMCSSMKECDHEISQLAASVPVDIMPGASDPSNYLLPQQPLHPCLLPLSEKFRSAQLTTNPHKAWISNRLFLGSSGQPVENILQYTDENSTDSAKSRRLEIMEDTLRWRHMCPTAPDTLGSYPCADDDPFIIDECPHVYFAGNQPQFETSFMEGDDGQQVRVICVPPFSSTGQAVFVNLRNLDAEVWQFESKRMDDWADSAS